jgi:hypothetical protein
MLKNFKNQKILMKIINQSTNENNKDTNKKKFHWKQRGGSIKVIKQKTKTVLRVLLMFNS